MIKANYYYLSFLFISSLLLVSSCDDPCKDITCENGGICMEGDCECPDGYSGELCEQVDIETFELVWSNRILPNQEVIGSDVNQVYENIFLHFGDLEQAATIYAQDILTGDRVWTYEYSGFDTHNIDFNYLYQNILICVTRSRVFGFDLNNQEVVWEYNLQAQFLRDSGNITNDKFYLVVSENFDSSGGFNESILEFDPFTGAVKEIVKYFPDAIGTKTISPPVFWKDNILVYNFRPNSEQAPELVQQYIIAYDFLNEVELWRTLVTDSYASNGLIPPIINNDVVITGGDYSIYAFDLNTGDKLWKTSVPGLNQFAIWRTTNHLIHNNQLYVNDIGTNSLKLNIEDGSIIWHEDFYSSNCTDNMLYYEKKDYLIFTSWAKGSVIVLNALTGELVHRENGFENSAFNNDIVYDDQKDMFFTTTYQHAIAFKIN